jgi:hypothetical protein
MEKQSHYTLKGKLGNEIYVPDSKVGGYTACFSDFPEIIAEGECIGHKRIQNFDAVTTSKLRLSITENIASPIIKNFSVYYVN